ncbi:MAG: GNAT family N-acetyltransferase [Aurantimonas endophytica]|jgi:GNAT superfamily N-acetyltransferase|uniref:GNAT superfamily N-acetyltransferase n=1 Tax=Aurantimonas endophytica TaxID=1522175 RepID=A0A7W6HH11_9HYPH|nr:GNAT family N-acetyltransferase [Aurantimonas endophytica]MBB4004846.1 GNAT superfamily N-acetyltransferase [Aurantimonas endophytica]MCO6405656.1 GNAT family N-acetyltransferase [Aurantimonas endophytica]
MTVPTIRPARREDVSAIVALLAEDDIGGAIDTGAAADLPLYEAQFERIAASATEFLFVAEIEGRVVGTFEIVIARSLPYRAATRCILEAVQVHPAMRGQRIGEAMVLRAMEEGRARGADVITLTSNVKREAAHRFYDRLGFERSHVGFKRAL